VLRYNISNPSAPQYIDTVVTNNDFIWDVSLRNGYAFVATEDLRVINTNVTPSMLIIPDRFTDGHSISVATDGTYVFVGQDSVNGRITTFDASALPAPPHWLKNHDLGGSVNFHKLILLGSSYLIGITPQGTNDVWIIDRTDINNLRVVGQVPIPAFGASTAKLVGNLLYVTSRTAGLGVAVVDVSNPTSPLLKSTIATRGYTFGIDASGTTVAVGDGSPGITILDATDPAAPKLLGTQFVGGSVWDVVFQNNTIWCTTEVGIAAVQNFATNPSP
jgi:hypothetical protein